MKLSIADLQVKTNVSERHSWSFNVRLLGVKEVVTYGSVCREWKCYGSIKPDLNHWDNPEQDQAAQAPASVDPIESACLSVSEVLLEELNIDTYIGTRSVRNCAKTTLGRLRRCRENNQNTEARRGTTVNA